MTRRYATDKPETTQARAMREAIERLPVVVLRLHSGKTRVKGGYMKHNEKGTPDVCVLLPGARCMFFETKTPDGELSEDQQREHARLRAMGHIVIVPRTVQEGLDAVAAEMRGRAA